METRASGSFENRDFLALIDFVLSAGKHSEGFADIDMDGRISSPMYRSTLTNSRMTFVMAAASLLGVEQARPALEAGVKCLREELHDKSYGGYFDFNAPTARAERKLAYNHVFVLLAGASAANAGEENGLEIAREALSVIDQHFWNEDLGILNDEYDRTLSFRYPYFGGNSNMHAVEAFLASAKVLERPDLITRAERIAEFFIDIHARQYQFMLPEHYDFKGEPDLNYNRHQQEDVFKPYGVTVGHLFEWSRLLLELEFASDNEAPWRVDAALGLYNKAKELGLEADGKPGFVYTVDFSGEPISTKRLHWVVCEAIACAATLQIWTLLGDTAEFDQIVWGKHLRARFFDPSTGVWHHELDSDVNYSGQLFSGKPDAYHLTQAFLVPLVGKGSGLIQSIQESLGRS